MVGNERRTKFWRDRWCGDIRLEVTSAHYSLLPIQKRHGRGIYGVWSTEHDGDGGCSPTFSHPFKDWELDEVVRFLG